MLLFERAVFWARKRPNAFALRLLVFVVTVIVISAAVYNFGSQTRSLGGEEQETRPSKFIRPISKYTGNWPVVHPPTKTQTSEGEDPDVDPNGPIKGAKPHTATDKNYGRIEERERGKRQETIKIQAQGTCTAIPKPEKIEKELGLSALAQVTDNLTQVTDNLTSLTQSAANLTQPTSKPTLGKGKGKATAPDKAKESLAQVKGKGKGKAKESLAQKGKGKDKAKAKGKDKSKGKGQGKPTSFLQTDMSISEGQDKPTFFLQTGMSKGSGKSKGKVKGKKQSKASLEQQIREYFDDQAKDFDGDVEKLHEASHWHMAKEDYEEMVLDACRHMKPNIRNGESVFDLGVGAGAALQVLTDNWRNLKLGGSDYSAQQITVARKMIPGGSIYHKRMTDRISEVKDGAFDHVISIGALALYLTVDDMLKALSEAARMTKPCGSVVFTQFIEPGFEPGRSFDEIIIDGMNVTQKVEKACWAEALPALGFENIETHDMGMSERDGYLVAARKVCPSGKK